MVYIGIDVGIVHLIRLNRRIVRIIFVCSDNFREGICVQTICISFYSRNNDFSMRDPKMSGNCRPVLLGQGRFKTPRFSFWSRRDWISGV